MLRHFGLFAVLWLGTCAVFAQESQGPPPERMRAIARRPIQRLEGIAQEIAPELNLTEQQQTQLDEILEGYRKQFSDPTEIGRLPAKLAEEYRQAHEAGDEAKLRDINDRMRLLRGEVPDKMLSEFFEKVSTILDDQQREALKPIIERNTRIQNAEPTDMNAAVDSLPKTLSLTDAQRAKYDELRAALTKAVNERETRAKDNLELIRQMHEAQDAGDDARAQEILGKLRGQRGHRPRPYEDFFAGLEKVLTDEQKTKLADFRQNLSHASASRMAPAEAGRPLDLRSVLRAVQRIEVTREQEEKLDKIMSAAREQYRDEAFRDPAARARLTLETKQKVLEVLNDEQKARFEELLQGRSVPEQPTEEQLRQRPGRKPEPPKP